jgi:hypothetical protein
VPVFRPAPFTAPQLRRVRRSALYLTRSHSFSPAAVCENSLISKRRTKEFCEIAVILVSAPYCAKSIRVPVAEIVRGISLTALLNQPVLSALGKSNVGYRGQSIGADCAAGAIE